MVEKFEEMETKKEPALKFGIDRILSNSPASLDFPCSENFQRCVQYRSYPFLANFRIQPPYRPSNIYMPQPVRPYHNIVIQAESQSPGQTNHQQKRKRSWSRAVFSNLQRKGLEKRFQLQKYITKPDRRQLAATLGLTDAQVKVWFQNRRMKWRHAKEGTRDDGKNPQNAKETCKESSESDSDVDIQTVECENKLC